MERRDLPVVVIGAGPVGLAAAVATLLRASMIAEAFDRRQYGRVSGPLALATTAACSLGPLLAAVACGFAASYSPAFLGLAGLLGAAAISVARSRRLSLEGLAAHGR